MPTNGKGKEDAALAPAAVVKAAVEIERARQHLESDLKLLRMMVDHGMPAPRMAYGALSAQLTAAELLQGLVKLQIALADEES